MSTNETLESQEGDNAAIVTLIYQIRQKKSDLDWKQGNLETAKKNLEAAQEGIERCEYEIRELTNAVVTLRGLNTASTDASVLTKVSAATN